MESLMKDIIGGFVILSIICAMHGCTRDMVGMAGKAQKKGIMSYKAYTEQLTK